MTPTDRARLVRYPWYVAGMAAHAWVPVFFLYLSSRVDLPEVLALEAIYYATVVVMELPSGYFSDRVGRRPTLVLAAAAVIAAHCTFALGDDFAELAVAQVLLATGLAFNSGTDTSYHLAALTAADQQHTYAEREARLAGLTFAVGAITALAGGAAGVVDLRLAYLISGAGAATALLAALSLAPLPARPSTGGFTATVTACLRAARARPLRWLFAVSVAGTVVNHLPYEFYQPYLDALPARPWPDGGTPLIAGIHAALVAAVAMVAARFSAAGVRRWGLAPILLGGVALQAALVGLMALIAHPIVAVLLVARSVPAALQSAPLRAAIAPRVGSALRATYLSLQSLAGRLAFAVVLLGLAAAGDALDRTLAVAALIPLGLLGGLLLTRPRGSTTGP